MARPFKKASLPHLAALDSRNTNRYYASGDVSALPMTPDRQRALQQRAAASRRQPARPLAHLDERDPDRSYRSDDGPPRKLKHTQRRKNVMNHPLPDQGSTTQAVQHPQSVHALKVMAREQINVVVDTAIQRVRGGQKRVIIEAGPGLAMAVTTRLDSLVTRTIATEEERFSVVVKALKAAPAKAAPAPAAAPSQSTTVRPNPETRSIGQMLGEPEPADKATTEKPLTQDPADFLKSADAPEESALAPPTPVEKQEVIDTDRVQKVEDNDLLNEGN